MLTLAWMTALKKRFAQSSRLGHRRFRHQRTGRDLQPTIEEVEKRLVLSAIVSTDLDDYPPGSTAYITATSDGGPEDNFQMGETVEFIVRRTDGIEEHSPDGETYFPQGNEPWRVEDGVDGFDPYQDESGMWWYPDLDGEENGQFETTWYVDEQYAGALLELTATGLTSGEVTTAEFTDATSGSITTGTVANLAPSTAMQGATNVPILTFTLTSSRSGGDTFDQAKLQYVGTARADISGISLYQESGGSGGTFDAATDTLLGTDTVLSSDEFTISGFSYVLPQNVAKQFYVVVGIKSTATVGNVVDVKVEKDKLSFTSGTWPINAQVDAGTWNPAGSTTITAANSPPTATNLNAAESYTEDIGLNLTDIVVTDVDSASVTATLTLSNVAAGSLSTATSGAVTSTFSAGVWTASGAIANVNTLLAGVIFTPALNFNTNFSIATSVSDGVAAAITGTKAMTGIAVNDAPTCEDGVLTVDEDDSNSGTLSGSDIDSGTLTFSIVTNGTHGTAVITNAATGAYTYTATDPDYNGSDSFTFSVSDGALSSAEDCTVEVTISPVNDAPTCEDGVLTVDEDDSNSGTLSGSDIDSGTLTFSIVTNGTHGTAVITNAATGAYTYTATDPDYNGSDSFTFSVSDGALSSAEDCTVEVTISPVNDAPVAGAGDDQTVDEGDMVALAGSFSDPDSSDTHTFLWEVVASNGQVIADGTSEDFSFTPNDNGIYTVTFTVSDGDASDSDEVVITVDNVAPTITTFGVPGSGSEGSAVNLSAVVSDPANTPAGGVNDPLTYAWTVTGPGGFSEILSGSSPSFTPPDQGTYTVTLVVSDGDGGSDTLTGLVVVANLAPQVTASPSSQTVQYSDHITSVTITATDSVSDTLTATINTSVFTGLTLTSGGSTVSGALKTWTWTLTGKALLVSRALLPGTLPGSFKAVTISDEDGGSTDTACINVNKEDALATYTGAVFASTSSASSSAATITLSATIRDITAALGDPAYDACAGDIRNATVTFINRDTNTSIATVAVGLVSAGDTKVGTATYNWGVNIGSANSQTFTVGIVVNGYYTRNSSGDNTVVTVSKPLTGFITGGGYLTLTNSAGIKAGDVGTKNNFGFNVKYNKSNTNLQGNINTIIRRMESDGILHVYQVKGNAMTSLVVTTGKATFNGNANIQDITNPLSPISVDGNASLQVTMTDMGEPGSSDSISITVWNKNGGLWFASKWDGIKTVEQVLGGGNLKVHKALQLEGQALLGSGASGVLTSDLMRSGVAQAASYWQNAGLGVGFANEWSGVDLQIADLPDGDLGWASWNTITLDLDAAGHGWSLGRGGVDLVSVLTHEFGHLLGFDHDDDANHGVMRSTLAAGTSWMSDGDSLASLKVGSSLGAGSITQNEGVSGGSETVTLLDLPRREIGGSKNKVLEPTIAPSSKATEVADSRQSLDDFWAQSVVNWLSGIGDLVGW